jgi:ABC-2 type transport system ATP-binding protein
MNTAVLFESVSYVIKKQTLLDNISFAINKGEITGILGPNGAGKSTLLSLINGLRKQTGGAITIFDEKLPTKDSSLRQKIGVVLQETALYEELTTFENLRFAAELYNLENPLAKIIEVLELLHISDRSDQRVNTLSGGLRRRVAIARSLLHDPELLLIDEPTLGVDVEARHAIWQHLRLLKSQGKTIIVATNYLDEAQALCDAVMVLQEGKMVTFETPETLMAKTGYCIDIETDEEKGKKIQKALTADTTVLRIAPTPSGISIFIKEKESQEHIINTILATTQIKGFKVRAPDLAEVFKTLEKKID